MPVLADAGDVVVTRQAERGEMLSAPPIASRCKETGELRFALLLGGSGEVGDVFELAVEPGGDVLGLDAGAHGCGALGGVLC